MLISFLRQHSSLPGRKITSYVFYVIYSISTYLLSQKGDLCSPCGMESYTCPLLNRNSSILSFDLRNKRAER